VSSVVLEKKTNSVRLKLPGREETVEVAWGPAIETVWRGAHLQPSYHYRWEEKDEHLGREAEPGRKAR